MSASSLSRKLILEEAHRAQTVPGALRRSGCQLGALWADVRPSSGRERASLALLTVSTLLFRITVRGAPPGSPQRPRPDQRFRDGARIFGILAVTESDSTARFLTCYAREEVAA